MAECVGLDARGRRPAGVPAHHRTADGTVAASPIGELVLSVDEPVHPKVATDRKHPVDEEPTAEHAARISSGGRRDLHSGDIPGAPLRGGLSVGGVDKYESVRDFRARVKSNGPPEIGPPRP